jgi:TolB protein
MTRLLGGCVLILLFTLLGLNALALTWGQQHTSAQVTYAAWERAQYHLFTLDLNTGLRHSLADLPAQPCCISYSPAGDQLAFLASFNNGPQRLYLTEWDGQNTRRLTESYVTGVQPFWSPDGLHLNVQVPGNHRTESFLVQTRTQTWQIMQQPDGSQIYPAWSPDGARIAFLFGQQLILAAADCLQAAQGCSQTQPIPTEYAVLGLPSWSPDGRWLLLTHHVRGQTDLYRLDTWCERDCAPQPLVTERGQDNFAVWSPDGQRIAFAGNRSGTWGVYVMLADGSQLRLLSHPEQQSYAPQWSPDGSRLVYVVDGLSDIGGRRMRIASVTLAGAIHEHISGLIFNPQPVWWPG